MTITGLDGSMMAFAPPGLRAILTPPSLALILCMGIRVEVEERWNNIT